MGENVKHLQFYYTINIYLYNFQILLRIGFGVHTALLNR